MRNKTLLLIVALLLSSVLLSACGTPLAAQPVLAQGTTDTPQRTINVTGTGKVTLTPDIAYVSIGVHTEGKDAAEAVASNTSQAQKVVDALKTFKIDPKDIQTTNFSIYPQQQYDNEGKPQGITYVVDNTVYVTLRDITKLGELLDAVVTAGANSINSIQFDVADREAATSEARKLAVENAQKQAEELATAAGVKLGQVLSINSSSPTAPVPMYDYKMGVGGAAPAADTAVPVSAGQLIITLDVYMSYEIQ
jgi:uncharacterized protein YggE